MYTKTQFDAFVAQQKQMRTLAIDYAKSLGTSRATSIAKNDPELVLDESYGRTFQLISYYEGYLSGSCSIDIPDSVFITKEG